MAATNYTPISLYYSSTATNVPVNTNLVAGELAINTADGKLFYKDSSGVVQVLATKATGTISGSTGYVQFNNAGALGSNANFFWDNTNSRLGIGTSSPSTKLHVASVAATSNVLSMTGSTTAECYAQLNNTGGNFYLGLDNSTGGSFGGAAYSGNLYMSGAYPIIFYTSATERMRIDSSGNVGIGVTPSSWATYKTLQVAQDSFISFSGGFGVVQNNTYYNAGYKYITSNYASQYNQQNGAHIWTTAPSGTAGNAITFTEQMRIDASGNVIVAKISTSTTTRGAYLAATSGALNSAQPSGGSAAIFTDTGSGSQIGSINLNGTATAYATSSDYRLKENIAPMQNALAVVAQLKPVTYKWKTDGSNGQGFIAHELQEIVPDCVGGIKDEVDAEGNPKYQGVDTSFLVATLTAAIQEQQAIITDLTNRLTALEK